jgi:hypothetical protein
VAISVLSTTFLPRLPAEIIKFLLAPLLVGFTSYGIYRRKSYKFIILFCLAVIALKHLFFALKSLVLVTDPNKIFDCILISLGKFFTVGMIEFLAIFVGALIGFSIFKRKKLKTVN